MASRHKLYVGVDYGTTFSGFAFATSHSTGVESIEVITNWPGNVAGYREKVPSQIAYRFENNSLDEDSWGYAIPSSASKHCWTKLLLDKKSRATEYDDPMLGDMSEWRGLPLPSKKSAEDVVADYLSHLYQHCMGFLEKRMTQDVLKVTPIDFWFTMPALWSDEAQHATKIAAERAGFGKTSAREHDNISMIREPEAAAISALKMTADKYDDLLEVNTGILICDGGGGTVDVTSYTIVAITPTLKLEESCVGIGGKCGATYVDRNLEKLMAERYGDHYTSLPVHKRGAGSPFMKAFEDIRNDFDGSSNKIAPLQLIMKKLSRDDVNCIQYDPDEAEVTLTSKDIQKCFDPVISSMIALVEQQEAEVAKEGAPAIKVLVLVGGFGSSPYVWKKIKQWCGTQIRPICPDRPWSAIVRGAALRGLEGAIVTQRRCRRHYGTVFARPFQPGVEVKDHRVYHDPVDGIDYRKGWMAWPIEKGMKLQAGEKKQVKFFIQHKQGNLAEFHLDLYSCALDSAPARDDDPNAHIERVGRVNVSFTAADLSRFAKKKVKREGHRWSKDVWYGIDMICEVVVADEVGVLKVVVTCAGEPCGATKLTFPHD